jgi:predicted nuclease of predicted toxin-antitoxin system
LDKDFGELIIVRGHPHGGIIRQVNIIISARRQAAYCLTVLVHYQAELGNGAIITVEPRRVRIRS